IDRLSEVHDKVLEAFPHAALYKSVVGDKGRVCSFNLGRDILLTLSLSLDGSSVKWRVATPSGESRGWIWSGNLEQGIKSALKFIRTACPESIQTAILTDEEKIVQQFFPSLSFSYDSKGAAGRLYESEALLLWVADEEGGWSGRLSLPDGNF